MFVVVTGDGVVLLGCDKFNFDLEKQGFLISGGGGLEESVLVKGDGNSDLPAGGVLLCRCT